MVQKNIVCEGLRCCVHSKAAFIDWCMESSKESRNMLIQAMMNADGREGFFESSQMGSVVKKSILWNQEQKEHVFDAIIRRKLLKRGQEELPQLLAAAVGPALNMDHEEVQVESILFLAYAIVRNETCREAIMEYAEKEGETCYDAYKNSSYKDSDFLSWFLVADRLPASMAVGLIERIRLEEEAAEDSDADEHRRYKDFTEILEKGYRNLKNQLKKAEYIDGSMFQKIVQDSNDMVHAASEMMVLLVIAEELEIPVHEDYDFYLGLQILESYEEDLETLPEPEITENGGRRLHRNLQKGHPRMESYYTCYYLDGTETERTVPDPGTVFEYFHLNLRMLAGIELEQKDIDFICSLSEGMKWQEYKQTLLIASLCKYIHSLQQLCEKNDPEEYRYRQRRAEKDRKEFLNKIENLQSRTAYLEQKKRELENCLEQCEKEKEKLKVKIQNTEEKNALEREELISLRNYVFPFTQTGGKGAGVIQTESAKTGCEWIGCVQTENARTESQTGCVQTENARTKSAQTENARTKSAQTEYIQTENPSTESARTERVRTECARTECARTECARTECARAERAQAESAQTEHAQAECVLQERARTECAQKVHLKTVDSQAKAYQNHEESHRTEDHAALMKGEKMLIIGGHINWQRKMKQYLPRSQFLSSDNLHFDNSVLHCKRYIIFNTDVLKHGLYYKIIGQRKKEQKILYVHGNNIDKILQDINRQISS